MSTMVYILREEMNPKYAEDPMWASKVNNTY